MLRIQVENVRQSLVVQHAEGPLEFGRGPRLEVERCVVEDLAVSRDQMRVQALPDARIRIDNLSQRVAIAVRDRGEVPAGHTRELRLPVQLAIGATTIEISSTATARTSSFRSDHGDSDVLATISPVTLAEAGELRRLLGGDAPDVETLTRWFETVVQVQQAAATSAEFYEQTAAAVVELVGLDEGLVLVRSESDWEVAAHAGTGDDEEPYSRRIIDYVVERKQTFFRELDELSPTASLANVSAAVASPIVGPDGDTIVGVVYGRRGIGAVTGSPIRPLEAQLVQVLASAVGAGLSRLEKAAEASRWRVQLESFFTPRLVEELDRNPNLLDGDERDVTVLFADLRGFTDCTARLGAAAACRLVGDVMDNLSNIVQRHDGVIVDYYGDGLMAMWNAPIEQADHAARALTAALEMQAELPGFGVEWNRQTGRPLGVGVGVNTGHAVVGNVGSRHKFKYGALGLTVNLAQRIESATKLLGSSVLCSGTTHSAAGLDVPGLHVGRCRLSGALDPVDLVALRSDGGLEPFDEIAAAYSAALDCFERGRWQQSVERVAAAGPLAVSPLGQRLAHCCRALDAENATAEEAVIDLRTK